MITRTDIGIVRTLFAAPGWMALCVLLLVSGTAFAETKEIEEVKGAGRKVVAPSVASSVVEQPTVEEGSTLEDARREDLEIMIRRAQDFREVIDGMVRRVYDMRRGFIDKGYDSKIKSEETLELKSLKSAIEYFEAFLRKYPDDPPYTPDAMFRLAELHYDYSYLQYIESLDGGGTPAEKNFDRSIDLFRRLIINYPDYRAVDGAYYLLGYCLNETGEPEEARLAWLNLVCANKYEYRLQYQLIEDNPYEKASVRTSSSLDTGVVKAGDELGFVDPFAQCEPITDNSRFFFETWWLVGEYHFDYDSSDYGVETAMAAYKKLIADPSHPFYDRGLYKLAWSYFKADMYPESIRRFSDVVDFADKKGGKSSGMRPEAIQYLAVCFFSDDWNADMVTDATSGIARLQDPDLMPQDRKWTREVYSRLGEIYSENEKHTDAITVWELFLKRWPLDVQAPFLQDKIADAYRNQRMFDEELAARSELHKYSKDSEWWKANEDHPDAQNAVATMAQDAIINSALTHHQNAQALKIRARATDDDEIMKFALDEYNLAAQAYRSFLDQNPDTPDAYDLNFQLADCLFWSGKYPEAKKEYAAVRDSNLDDRHREESAKFVVLCVEAMLEQDVSSGKLTMRSDPPPLAGDPPTPEALELPPRVLELQEARETYLLHTPDAPKAPVFKYQKATDLYRYGHWDEAKVLWEDLYNEYCKKDELSLESWRNILNMAADQNSLDEKERLALLEQEKQCAVEGVEFAEGEAIDLGTLLGDVAMQRAMSKFDECHVNKDPAVCTASGDQLVAAVAKAPKHVSADAALHNAALAYENAQRFETAMELYGRIVDEYPTSKYVDKCLFRQAFSANGFFEYEKALASYKILADEERFADSEYRIDALLNTAQILTNLQSYQEAIPYWTRYSKDVEDKEKSIVAAYNAADMLFRAKSWKAASQAFELFLNKYERNNNAGPHVVKAAFRMGEAEENRKKHKAHVAAWERTVTLYKRLVNESGSIPAEYAANSHFMLIEEDMRAFENFKISGTRSQIEKKQLEGAEKVKDFEARYRLIQAYGRPEWSLAAEFRIGYAYEVYAKAILETPMPSLDEMLNMAGLSKQEIRFIKTMPQAERDDLMFQIEDKIRAVLDTKVEKMEEKAQAEYKIAIELARKGNISNEWTLLALERMNAYDPENYPRQHNGYSEIEKNTLGVPPWAPEVE